MIKRLAIIADWWDELSPSGKRGYIAEHPNSRHAKDAIKKGEVKPVKPKTKSTPGLKKPKAKGTGVSKAPKVKESIKPSESQDIKDTKDSQTKKTAESPVVDKKVSDTHKVEHEKKRIEQEPKKSIWHKIKNHLTNKTLPKADHDFFEKGGASPNSEQRKTLAKHIRSKSAGIVQSIKHQHKEWKSGVGAIKKLASRQPLNDHDKEALKAISKDILITVGSVALTGGLGHGVALAMTHFGSDLIKDTVLKAFAHGVVESSTRLRVLELAAMSDDQFMKKVIDQLAVFIQDGNIPDDIWEKAVAKIAKQKDSTDKKISKKPEAKKK